LDLLEFISYGFLDLSNIRNVLKKVQKEAFSAAFQKLYDRAKACVHDNGAYFE
jgi:hypothetical protein